MRGKTTRVSQLDPRRNRNSRASTRQLHGIVNQNVESQRVASQLGKDARGMRVETLDGEFSLREVYGDGNCMFRAISFILWGTESRHRILRSLVVSHIENTWREVRSYVLAEWSIANIDEYKGFMNSDGTFASELEGVIATKLNRLNLAIYKRVDAAGNLERILYNRFNRRAKTANLLFSGRNEYGHYDVLLPVQ